MKLLASILMALVTVLALSCGAPQEEKKAPCPADGRSVAIYVLMNPEGPPERIEGKFVRWGDGWATVERQGLRVHIPLDKVYVIHENR